MSLRNRVLRTVARSGLAAPIRRLRWPPVQQPPAAPPLPRGFLTGAPDFVGLGAQKAGTTWWHRLVAAHPGVRESSDKELHFFDRFWDGTFEPQDADRYAALFPRRPGELGGEWSTSYLCDPWTPPLLAAVAPDARLLVLVRDPIERFRSGLTHELARGAPAHPVVVGEAVRRGLYFEQLSRFLRHFDRASILVLQYERCVAEPHGQLRRTYEFLGLDPDFVPPTIGQRVYETRGDKVELAGSLRDVLRAEYAADIRALVQACPEIDAGLWPSASVVV